MLGPPQRVGDRARPLAAGVPAQQLRYLHYILRTATAYPGHGLRGIASVVTLEDLEHAHGILERRVGSRQASGPIRAELRYVLPGTGREVVRAGGGVEPREQTSLLFVPIFIGYERRSVGVVDDVL
jgi:hypothetical protein